MTSPSKYLDALIREFSKLPGIGPKSASRLAFHILKLREEETEKLASSIIELRKNIRSCGICGGISDSDTCAVCRSDTRDRSLLCVVQEQKDAIIIENTGGYNGLYHILHGVLSPLDGIGPEDLTIAPLIDRCRDEVVREVIIATNPTVEGDATALYISRALGEINPAPEVMRIAHGLPLGSDLEFADSATLLRSIQARTKVR
ncbi:MAG TPA: recombination mediator RecR [Spirochaetota bacterium]|nr:recombination mediator RecR [Spirochaetota bacterium]